MNRKVGLAGPPHAANVNGLHFVQNHVARRAGTARPTNASGS